MYDFPAKWGRLGLPFTKDEAGIERPRKANPNESRKNLDRRPLMHVLSWGAYLGAGAG